MDINAAFPSNWLKAADLQGRSVSVKIDHVDIETVADEPKPVVYFQGKTKGLVLNKTNAYTISMIYGQETDSWQGAAIEIFPTQVDFQGRQVAAIRVRMAPPSQTAAPQPQDDPPPPQPGVATHSAMPLT